MYQLQKSSSFSVLNPKNLIRQNQTPVGLSNIGNTCFINALLQVYFMIPYFRKSILQKTPHEIEWKTQTKYFEKEYPYYPFILELQRLFSYLILSSKKYYNPLLALTRFFEIQQKQLLTFGNQEDITEFNSIFCEFVNEGLKSCDPKKNSKTKTAIEKLFEGKERHYIEGTEEQSKTKFSHVQTNKFLQIILSVESGDLYSSLNQYTSKTEIEFTNRNKPTINTTKQIKFARLPPMMIFQLQRAQFDPKSKSMFKNSSPFVFEEIIYMDRFMEENSDAQIDAQESEQKIKKLEQEITHMRDFNDLNLPLADLLGNTARYFRDEFKPKKDFPDFPLTQLTELLINEEYRVRSKFDKKEKKLADLKSLRRKSFEDMKKIPYKLFAVLLHSGLTSNSGHYYSFVNEPTTQKWWKFNDHFVSEVTLSEVFNTSIGDSVSSAYVLFYRKVEFDSVSNLELNSSQIRKRFFNLSNCEQYIPNELKQEIDFDNKVFSQQLSEYEILQNPEMAKEIQSMKKSIDKKFLQKQQIIQHDKDPEKDLEKDPGLLDFSFFVLNNFKDFVACKYLIALESFPLQKDLFNLIIEANIDSNTMDKQLQIYNQAWFATFKLC
ncbi:ubiquitin carboxyl-terminal hydrolase 14 [Anaeramoeba ignava]|uniref:Ubiquitin carboxyl-terminal hydrolase n=1 Tax=Anaeramoeba ignava TaxID=1746090 RepID=A0A9Q0L5D3_ANAIG|nr:ubiquitin carboxyl-terminal hydrolase 14 [Anaeramoeba ignava]